MPDRAKDTSFPLFAGAPGEQAPKPSGGTLTGSAVGQFAVVLRGYDRGQVDVHVSQLETSISELTRRGKAEHSELVALREQVEGHRREIAEARRILAETERPTYAGLGARAQELLRMAEEQAVEIVSGSEAERARRMSEVASQVTEIRRSSEAAALAAREGAEREAQARVDAAEQAAVAMRQTAAEAAERVRDEAEREAQTAREETAGDVEELRGSAERDSARVRAVADREAAEIRARSRGESEQLRMGTKRETDTLRAEVEQLAEEIRHRVNQDRSDLDVELARMRENSERDAAARHEAAVAGASRLMHEAEQRAEDARRRKEAATSAGTQLRTEAEQQAHRMLTAARAESESTLTDARTRADQMLAEALGESERLRAEAEQHAENLTRQHDSVQGYFNQLRAVLGSAGQMDEATEAVMRAAQEQAGATGLSPVSASDGDDQAESPDGNDHRDEDLAKPGVLRSA